MYYRKALHSLRVSPLLLSSTSRWIVRGIATAAEAGTGTLNEEEVRHFEGMANSWWATDGPLKELHSMNKLRVPLVRDGLLESRASSQQQVSSSPKPLEGFTLLDVGCGGGILTEPLGRLGASVIGLDPGLANIEVAERHLELRPELKENVRYECSTIESYVEKHPEVQFDGVVSSETVEHVQNPEAFLSYIGKCVKPGGSLFLTTPNRTFASWAGAIVAWEYVLRKLPVGTHDWKKFITPGELQAMLSNCGFTIQLVHGMCYNPIQNNWSWTKSTAINYCVHAVKNS